MREVENAVRKLDIRSLGKVAKVLKIPMKGVNMIGAARDTAIGALRKVPDLMQNLQSLIGSGYPIGEALEQLFLPQSGRILKNSVRQASASMQNQ